MTEILNLEFSARIITGDGRGRSLSRPTLNLNLDDLPYWLKDGIYACFVRISNTKKHASVLHVGLRPTFQRPKSAEVHLLDITLKNPPANIVITVIERLRDVQKFINPEALLAQITADVNQAHAILNTHDICHQKTHRPS